MWYTIVNDMENCAVTHERIGVIKMTREEMNNKKEMILKFVSSKEYKPMSAKEMGVVLQVPAKDKKIFREVLNELLGDARLHMD